MGKFQERVQQIFHCLIHLHRATDYITQLSTGENIVDCRACACGRIFTKDAPTWAVEYHKKASASCDDVKDGEVK